MLWWGNLKIMADTWIEIDEKQRKRSWSIQN